MVEVIKMGENNSFISNAYRYRAMYTREELKGLYHYFLGLMCYEMARMCLHALYGCKEPFYIYDCIGSKIYAFKYPPIKA